MGSGFFHAVGSIFNINDHRYWECEPHFFLIPRRSTRTGKILFLTHGYRRTKRYFGLRGQKLTKEWLSSEDRLLETLST